MMVIDGAYVLIGGLKRIKMNVLQDVTAVQQGELRGIEALAQVTCELQNGGDAARVAAPKNYCQPVVREMNPFHAGG